MPGSARPSGVGTYPEIPDQEFFSIGEACRLCLMKAHTLRHREREFAELRAVPRNNGRRCYTREHILLIRTIRDLMDGGLTADGVRKTLRENGKNRTVSARQVDVKALRRQISAVIRML